MDIFKTSNSIVDEIIFSNALTKLNLEGKDVLIYSRLLSFGRITNINAVDKIIDLLIENIGPYGTLIIPTYTLNSYSEKKFDILHSKIMSGILGEVASKNKYFTRTIHPVYSNAIFGYNKEYYTKQNASTCFGEGSFFDLFSKKDNSMVLMAGLNFNGPTLYHYYDQKYNAKGRFVKDFNMHMILNNYSFDMVFNSYVKDREFYKNKMNCLARFDSLANDLGMINSISLGDNYIHSISENNFHHLYRAVLEIDQEYFLLSSEELWDTYYMKNKYNCMHGKNDPFKTSIVKRYLYSNKH
jgi:aminoglycoside 3-N-acetyltransferase